MIDDDATKTLIIPIVKALHFFALVGEFNFECPELFLHFKYNDSLQCSSRGRPQIIQGTPAWLIVCEVRAFYFNFVFHNKNKFNYITPPTDDDLLNQMIGFRQCPGHSNDINCGLFCFAVVLYLLDDKPMTKGTFNFNHCILLLSKLAAHFNRNNGAYEQTSQVAQDCFPQLKSTSILSSYGVEVVATVPIASKPSFEDTKNDDEVILLSREDIEIIDVTTNKAKTPPTILHESNIACNNAATSNYDDYSTTGDSQANAGPKGNNASNATNDSQGCTRTTRILSFKIFFANLILLNFQLWMISV